MHASEGRHSEEIEKLRRIERFGLEAITGRKVFNYNEYKKLIVAENIVYAYNSRKQSVNWVEWAQSNPELAQMLAEIEKSLDS